eukprot:6054981-Pyramimonas_sp.AAC.2
MLQEYESSPGKAKSKPKGLGDKLTKLDNHFEGVCRGLNTPARSAEENPKLAIILPCPRVQLGCTRNVDPHCRTVFTIESR